MCRFVLYQGAPLAIASLVTEPVHSIINQSVRASESDEPLNGDGFGVAWYAHGMSDRPAVFRSISPAWSNMNLLELARVTTSKCILAHVRAATRGLAVTELNCHPFSAGPYAFMHNGDVARFGKIRRALLGTLSDEAFAAVKGSTDSEHVFGVFLDLVAALGGATVCKGRELDAEAGTPTAAPADAGAASDHADVMARALAETVARVVAISEGARPPGEEAERGDPASDGECDLNLAVSDGRASVVCRYSTAAGREPASLYLHTGRRYVCEGGVCRMISPETGHGAVIVCSEPLSDDPGWEKVKANHMVVVREDQSVETRAMG